MRFRLKNARAMYQRMITKMFGHLMGSKMEAYINDMVVKRREEPHNLRDQAEEFYILETHNLKLNAAKWAFGKILGKFLGDLVTWRRIETNQEQIVVI